MIKFYRHPLSGHSHRVELFLSLIGQPYELVDVDLLKGEQKSPDFLTLNPFGKVPVIIDVENGGAVISDSNAILVYLARQCADLSWYPDNPKVSADAQK
ncbi:MAG: glutathione S-transferase family protein, partial [Rhodospirillaceae bacterium]